MKKIKIKISGRPGWHIECSVMSTKYLKTDTLDIHAGGIDLVFPHHENEVAQSEALTGKPFARYWLHNGLLTINGEKMAKSLGNFVTIKDFIDKYHNVDFLKIFFLSTHYSHPIDFTEEKIEEAKKIYERLSIMLNKVNDILKGISPDKKRKIKESAMKDNKFAYIINQFEDAMDDDFNTPRALSVLQQLITRTNIVITQYPQLTNKDVSLQQLYSSCYISLPKIANIFGLDLNISTEMGVYLDEEVRVLIEKRNEARKNRNFVLADKIRDELEENGIILEDTKDGTTWRRKI